MFGLLPLLFALTIAETSTLMEAPFAPLTTWPQLLGAVGASLLVWLVLGEVGARVLAIRGQRRWLTRWDWFVQGLVLGWYAWVCYGWGWSAYGQILGMKFFLVALAPWVLMQAVHWWTLTVAVRRVSGHPWSRFGLILQQFRFGTLPMLLILPFFDIGKVIAVQYDLERLWFAPPWGPLLAMYCAQAFMVLLLLVLPLALLPLWGVQRMPASELQRLMLRACERLGVRVAGLMRWPMSGGRVYNAAVIGMLPRLRYVLFTEDLMRDLKTPELMAVLGHELGHARHGHLWLYVLFANAGLLFSFLLREELAILLLPLFDYALAALGVQAQPGQAMALAEVTAILVLMAVMWRLAFGVLSRACERQADLAGAELAGDPQVMCDALKSVAHLSGQGEDEPSWRHYSIAQRVAFLQAVRQRPEIATWHHHLVRMMRHGLILVIIALLLAASFLFDPRRDAMAGDPQQVLNEWVTRDPALGQALRAAESGDHLPLAIWLNRTDSEQRKTFAMLTDNQIIKDMGVDADGDRRFDDRPLYRWRHRLMAFQDISTGNPQLDLMLDNHLAYGLVAGTTEPTAADLMIASSILPRLSKHVSTVSGDHAVHDTIGCVQFAQGDFAKAVTSFEAVLKGFETESARTSPTWFTSEQAQRQADKQRAHLQSLYSQRLDAARSNAARVAAGTPASDPGLLPLPRDLGQARPEPSTPGRSTIESSGAVP
jgi:Zn-dependent protease with chaperone function